MLSDLELLQGLWAQVEFENNGVRNAPDEYGGALTTIAGHHFSVHTAEGGLLLEGRFEIDTSTIPKSINWIDAIGPDAGKTLPAIYELDGDRFVFNAADAGAPRPTIFRTTAGQTMRKFVRRS